MPESTYKLKIVSDISDITSNLKVVQQAMGNILPANVRTKFSEFYTQISNGAKKAGEQIENNFADKGALGKFDASMKDVIHGFDQLGRSINGLKEADLRAWFEQSDAAVKNYDKTIADLNQQIEQLSAGALSDAKNQIAALSKELEGKKWGASWTDFIKAFNEGDIDAAEKALNRLNGSFDRMGTDKKAKVQVLRQAFAAMRGEIEATVPLQEQLNNVQTERADYIETNTQQLVQLFASLSGQLQQAAINGKEYAGAQHSIGESVKSTNDQLDSFSKKITYFFGMDNAVRLLRRSVQDAYRTIQDLDKVMTETAVVTNFSVGDMWAQLPEYTERANALGVSIHDAYEAATLYYQQGLKTNEVVEVSTETLKMARIAGLSAADATDRMTNALRGFNMEIDEANAKNINDVYSKLAAITASNVDEISTAMTKVASLANNANMSFENTAAFLSQIIETTRESAETAGTALKTVVARFSEVKNLYTKGELLGTDAEGEEINVNRVATALRSAGINLNEYLAGNKGLDEIFIDLSKRWDSLDQVQQRYIATMAAGSRQQSRFIALMQDYNRMTELTAAANNAAGASQEQFNKTLDSLQSKLNQLKNSWNTFTLGIANDSLVKAAVDTLNAILSALNSITAALPGVTKSFGNLLIALIGFKGGKALFGSISKGLGAVFTRTGGTAASAFTKGFAENLKDTKIWSPLKQIWGKQGVTLFDSKQIGVAIKEGKNGLNDLWQQYDSYTKNIANRTYNTIDEMSAAITASGEKGTRAMQAMNAEMEQSAQAMQKVARSAQIVGVALLAASAGLNKWAEAQEKAGNDEAAQTLRNFATAAGVAGAALTTLIPILIQFGVTSAAALGWISLAVVAVAALAAGIVTLVQNADTAANRQKKLKKAAEDAAQAAKEAADNYNSLVDGIKELNDQKDALNGLTKGTQAYRDAVRDANEKTLEFAKSANLMSKLKYNSETGQWYLTDEDLAQAESASKRAKQTSDINDAVAKYNLEKYVTPVISKSVQAFLDEMNRTGTNPTEYEAWKYARTYGISGNLWNDYQGYLRASNTAAGKNATAARTLLGSVAATSSAGGAILGGVTNIDQFAIDLHGSADRETFITDLVSEFERLPQNMQDFLASGGVNATWSQIEAYQNQLGKAGKYYETIDESAFGDFIDYTLGMARIAQAFQGRGISTSTIRSAFGSIGSDTAARNLLSTTDATNANSIIQAILGLDSTKFGAASELLSELLEKLFKEGIDDADWTAIRGTLIASINGINNARENLTGGKATADDISTLGYSVDELLQNGSIILTSEGYLLVDASKTDLEKAGREAAMDAALVAQTAGFGNQGLNAIASSALGQYFSANEIQSRWFGLGSARTAAARAQGQEYGASLEDLVALENNIINTQKGIGGAMAAEIAASHTGTLKGMKDLVGSYKEWSTLLVEGRINTKALNLEQLKTYQQLKTNVQNVLGLSKELPDDLFESADAMSLLKAAAEGSEEAYNQLREVIAVGIAGGSQQISDLLTTLPINYNLAIGQMDAATQDALQTIYTQLEQSGLTTDGIQEFFAALGFEVDTLNKKFFALGSSFGNFSDDVLKGMSDNLKSVQNKFDYLYNVLAKISELSRQRSEYERQYNRYINNTNTNGADLIANQAAQVKNLREQSRLQQKVIDERRKELADSLNTTQGLSWMDNGNLRINWNAINNLGSGARYEEVEAAINRQEEIIKEIHNAEDAIEDNTDAIFELRTQEIDTYLELEQTVYDAIVAQKQAIIDDFSDISDKLDNYNQKVIKSLREQVALERQIRDNTKTEEDITDKENRLAYLSRDTSGANATEILQLQKDLGEARQSYSDSLIDQAIDQIESDNDLAAEQRAQQIDIMQHQLDYYSKTGEYWTQAGYIIQQAFGGNGRPLIDLLKETEGFKAMSQLGQQQWQQELMTNIATAALGKTNLQDYLTGMLDIKTEIENMVGANESGTYQGAAATWTETNTKLGDIYTQLQDWYNKVFPETSGGGSSTSPQLPGVTGIVDRQSTTPSLNLGGKPGLPLLPSDSSVGGSYYNISIGDVQLSNDYDWEKFMNKIEQELFNVGAYRNTPSLGRSRG